MKTNKFYKWLIESPMVYYLYNRGSIIYGLNTEKSNIDFLVVVDPKFTLPEEFSEYKTKGYDHRDIPYRVFIDNCDFIFFTTNEWFSKVTHGDIIAWECACLPKKFIHKEHVKLMMTTNPLQLRKDADDYLELYYMVATNHFQNKEFDKWKKQLWDIIKYIKLTNQIIENHKIIDFKEANSDYRQLVENNYEDEVVILKIWLDLLKEPIGLLHKSTDGMLKQEKEKKIIQNEKK